MTTMTSEDRIQNAMFKHLPKVASNAPQDLAPINTTPEGFHKVGLVLPTHESPAAPSVASKHTTEPAHADKHVAVSSKDVGAHKADHPAEQHVAHAGGSKTGHHADASHHGHSTHLAHNGHAGGHHKAEGHAVAHADHHGSHAADVKLTGTAALTAAISDHMSKHGMASDSHHAGFVAKSTSEYLTQPHDNKTTLAMHKEGGVIASMYGPGEHKASAGDPPSIHASTLDYIKDHGMPNTGLALARAAMPAETKGMSNLDLMERVGPAVLESIGEKGLNVAKLDTLHEHIADNLKGTGFDTQLSKLDSLKTMHQMAKSEDHNFVAVDKEKGLAGVMSLPEVQKHHEAVGGGPITALDLSAVKEEIGMAVRALPEVKSAEAAPAQPAAKSANTEMAMM